MEKGLRQGLPEKYEFWSQTKQGVNIGSTSYQILKVQSPAKMEIIYYLPYKLILMTKDVYKVLATVSITG